MLASPQQGVWTVGDAPAVDTQQQKSYDIVKASSDEDVKIFNLNQKLIYIYICIYMSEAQKGGWKIDDEVWSFHSNKVF